MTDRSCPRLRRSLRPSALLLIPLAGLVILRLALSVADRVAGPDLVREGDAATTPLR